MSNLEQVLIPMIKKKMNNPIKSINYEETIINNNGANEFGA